jgi:sortase A
VNRLRVGGALAVTTGFVALAVLGWNLLGPTTDAAQRAAGDALAQRWAAPSLPVPAVGDPIARLRIPRLGVDQVVLEGADDTELANGPGHYPRTALPGEQGNVGIAGHRVTHGAPFNRLDELQGCDEILIDERDVTWTYRVLPTPGGPNCGLRSDVPGQEIVTPDRVDVLNPVPGRSLLTLTTCHPEFSARERLIVHAELVNTTAA